VTDSVPTPAVQIVRGEIQPWTDYTGYRAPAGGEPLLALLDDLLPASATRVLIAGPHALPLIELVAGRSAALTVLVRSVSDAQELRAAIPAGSELLGPAPMFRVRNRHRRRILIKADDREGTVTAVREVVEKRAGDRSLKDVALGVDVDPQ